MRVQTTLTGTKPLLTHNVRLANPDDEWSKRISAVTNKRKKTDDDRKEIGRLEWFGSLYTDQGVLVIPTGNLLKCFIETGKITKLGKSVNRALVPLEITTPLIFNGPQDPEKLWEKEEFRDVTLVGLRGKRVVRTRPIFRAWGLVVEWELLTTILDYEDFVNIVNQAGIVEGLGDNRTNGYGRFEVEIAEVSAVRKAA